MNDYVGGLFAGVVSTFVSHPLDTLKVTMQYHSTHSISGAIRSIVKLNSIGGFYRGVSPNLITQCASQTSFYGTYAGCLRLLGANRDDHESITLLQNFIAGSFGGLIQAFPSSVFELLKIRLQTTSHQQEANVYQVFRHLIKTEGFRGLTCGLHATIWRDTPTYGLYMMIYDPLKRFIHTSTSSELIGGLISGGTVGVISWTLACPVDICKSKQQAGYTNKSLLQCLVEVYRTGNGMHAFFCGWTAVATRAFILNAISLFVWDRTRRWFG
ncbi:unnamed protein product [Adineta steineri]|uniref:Mitochondrial carrier protein n=1 Tax=Adineta steineri TaxID=433720 RepID=A0A813WSM3_9BILA|nr:unnamed protein product [Adineta steineri]CAF0883352.1 unnamed protein product [Adineta steineri]CAF3542712.1 unnamed protein product [Adineta steineri]CAF3718277.1 unnamed protein product [Adineta steineri]